MCARRLKPLPLLSPDFASQAGLHDVCNCLSNSKEVTYIQSLISKVTLREESILKTLKILMEEADKRIADELFSLNKRTDTGEYHIFLNKRNDDKKCAYAGTKSICMRMTRDQTDGTPVFSCQGEVKARAECARIGRAVCGTCVSHLYTDYEKK
ncbi:hypothetical protein Agau_P100154 (plasmid) [Agrobacterium tumefaciens F2]|nr:hypothetical protein Agau_P100154 [Agrobacterium tumefaciens F2]